jgi:hypothetical protein
MLMKDRFVVAKTKVNKRKEFGATSLHIWEVGGSLKPSFWDSALIDFSPENSVVMYEVPVSVVSSDRPSGDYFIGLNNGGIHKVVGLNIPGKHDGIPYLVTFSRFSDYHVLRGRERMEEEDFIIRGGRKIRAMARLEGIVYDASLAGLFQTEKGEQLDSRRASHVVAYNGRLFFVPTLPTRGDARDSKQYQSGSLIDAITKEVLVEKLTPFDGSGCSQGDFIIAGNLAFVHHGDWPDEEITIRELPHGRITKVVQIPTTHGFVEHKDLVYDFRDLRQIGEEGVGLMLSNSDGKKGLLFRVRGAYTSAVSAGDMGILVACYDPNLRVTRVVSHNSPETSLLEEKGYLKLFPA